MKWIDRPSATEMDNTPSATEMDEIEQHILVSVPKILLNVVQFSGTWSLIHFCGTWSIYLFHRYFLYLFGVPQSPPTPCQ